MEVVAADVSVHPLIRRRWSTRGFVPRPIPETHLCALFEAARWAPSSYNEQPWSFLVAVRGSTTFHRFWECLFENNRRWAKDAGALILSVARKHRLRDGAANRYAWHDVGLATANLLLQATALGLSVTLMGGFEREQARELFQIPEDHEPVAAMAVGYYVDPERLPDGLPPEKPEPRERKALEQFVFAERWGQPAAFLERSENPDETFRP